MKFPMRVFGEITGLAMDKTDALRRLLAGGPFTWSENNRLTADYEGAYLDIEAELDLIASALADHGHGYVDCIDHENWEMLRYQIQPGSWSCKRVDPDGVLEQYNRE